MERRQANRPPRYNHLHLGGPVRAQPAGTSSIQARTPLGCQLAIAPLLEDRRAGRRRSPHPRSRHSPRANAAACLAITSPVERAAEAQHHRSRSRSSTTPPDTSDSSRKPLPLGPPNVPPLSSGRIRKPRRVSRNERARGTPPRARGRRCRSPRGAAVCFNGLLGSHAFQRLSRSGRGALAAARRVR